MTKGALFVLFFLLTLQAVSRAETIPTAPTPGTLEVKVQQREDERKQLVGAVAPRRCFDREVRVASS